MQITCHKNLNSEQTNQINLSAISCRSAWSCLNSCAALSMASCAIWFSVLLSSSPALHLAILSLADTIFRCCPFTRASSAFWHL